MYAECVFVVYRGYERSKTKPLFPFGYGLSYTSFKYSNLIVKSVGTSVEPKYEVSFDITNTGKRAGAEVAQIYVADGRASVPRPPKELKGFSKVVLRPGQTRRVMVPLGFRSLAYYDVAGKQWRADAEQFDILVGQSSEQIVLRGRLLLARGQTHG